MAADPALLALAARLSAAEQAAIAELAAGDMDLHCFFATRSSDSAASLDDLDNVPFFCGGFETNRAPDLAEVIAKSTGRMLEVKDGRSGIVGRLMPGKFTRELLLEMDGERPLSEIFARARSSSAALSRVSDREFVEEFRPVFELFSGVDGMLLRHRDVPRFPTSGELAQLAFRWQQRPQDLPRR